ncbi:hypothetical protein, partial [Raoultella sp. Lac1]|uniref:hypothetical protein n=1 Tax=Raoultella sp. Lac1 TaxID=2594422 RepID=UPI001D110BB4
SADGSVGSPHVRVGNCQASNKAEGPVERPGLLFICGLWRKQPVLTDGLFAFLSMTNLSILNTRQAAIKQAFPQQIR